MTDHGPAGTLTREDDVPVITFTRRFAADPATVWEALTTAAGLESWLVERATVVPGADGSIDMEFDADNRVTGRITIWEPTTRFAHEWIINDEFPSEITYELTPSDSGTELLLVHRGLPDEMAGGYTPGWHAFMVRLDAHMAGSDVPAWDGVFAEVMPQYR